MLNEENNDEIINDLETAAKIHRRGNTTEAATLYKKAWYKMEKDISQFDSQTIKTCMFGLLKGYLIVGDYLSANDLLMKFEKHKQTEPSETYMSQLYYIKGWIAMKKHEFDSAVSLFHNSNDSKQNYSSYKALYHCYIKKNNTQLALASLFKGIELSSEDNTEQYVKDVTNLAVLLNKNKYTDIGLQYMETLRRKDLLNKTSNRTKFGFLFNLSEHNLLAGKYEEAEECCDELIELINSFGENNETRKWKLFVNIKKIKILNLADKTKEANKLKLSLYVEKSRLNGSLLFICGHYVSSSNVKIAEQLLKKNPKDIFALLVILLYNLESYKGNRGQTNTLQKIKVYADKILMIDNTNINALLCLIHAFIFTDKIKEASNLFSEIQLGRKVKMTLRNRFEFKLTGAQILACFKDNNIVNRFRECESLASNINERAEIVHYIVNSYRKNDKKFQEAIEMLESFMSHWDNSLDNSIKIFTKFVYCTILLEQLSGISDVSKRNMTADRAETTLKELLKYKPKGERVFKTVSDKQIVLSCKQLRDYFERTKKRFEEQNNK